MKRKPKRKLLVALAFIFYPALVLLADLPLFFIDKYSPSISEQVAKKYIIEESAKLNLGPDTKINLVVLINQRITRADTIFAKDHFTITISDYLVSRRMLKHEIYHVARISRLNSDQLTLFRYFYVEEPLAIIYSNFGIDFDFWH